jgi:molybdate transport system substrate-binding protein
MRTAIFGCLILSLIAGCAKPPRTPPFSEVSIAAAASTQDVVGQILVDFRDVVNPVEFTTNYGSSATLARQIEQGAQVDVFLAASNEWADYLRERNLIADERKLLGNRLVVVVPADESEPPKTLESLKGEKYNPLAMGDVKSVPAGVYAKQALENAGLWEAIGSRGTGTGSLDVRQALVTVERGEALAGIVYATDAYDNSKVKVAFEIDAALHEPIVYPLVLVKSAVRCSTFFPRPRQRTFLSSMVSSCSALKRPATVRRIRQ